MTKRRDHALDFLKITATLVIVLHHYERAFGTHFSTLNFGNGVFYFGYMVELFFMISGFIAFSGIGKIQEELSFDKYFRSRLLRLLPLAALSTAVFSAMYLIVWGTEGFSLFKAIATAACIQKGGPFDEALVNSHLWYLSMLLICYAFFFIIIRAGQRLRINWRYGCLFMIVLGASITSATWDLPFLNNSAARGYMSFFMGVLLAAFLKEHEPGLPAFFCSLAIVTATVLMLVFRYDIMEYGIGYILAFVFYPALIILFESPPLQAALDRRILGIMAQIAFNVYIWHFDFNTFCAVVNDLFKLGIDYSTRKAEMAVVLLCIVIGTLSFYLIEKPLSKLIKKRLA
ncbi:MAG: acyltransferase [Oscillospiraceae bacterium]|nr:acyltransferase [Oscillospiraceae bacterium]